MTARTAKHLQMTAHERRERRDEANAAADFTGHRTILLVEDEESLRSPIGAWSALARLQRDRGVERARRAGSVEKERCGRPRLLRYADAGMDSPSLLTTMRGRNPDLQITRSKAAAENAAFIEIEGLGCNW